MANINKIKLSGTTYSIQDENACKVVELTQAEYDDLPTSAKTSNSLFVITDAEAGDLSNYYTKTETDNAITAATSTKQDTLVSGTNIKTINGETLLGEGNITIQGGGGKAVSAGTNISITSGETADTINCTLPITATSSPFNTISVGVNSRGGEYNTLIGPNIKCDYGSNHNVFLIAQSSTNSSQGSYVKGSENVIIGSMKNGEMNWDIPSFRTSKSVVIGGGQMYTDKDNSLAIGYNANVSGTTKTNINNQLTIDTSNQVYIYNKDNTEMICLQDQLGGGGGSSYTAGDGIEINNDVISVTGKVDTSTYNTYTAATDTALASKQTTLTAGTGISIVDNVISATGGGGGMTEDDELLLSTALTDLNDRKIDASEVKSMLGNYQKKDDYATKDYVTTALESYETKLDGINTEKVTAYALNDLNNRFGGLSLVKITESEYSALATKDENTLYIVVADQS